MRVIDSTRLVCYGVDARGTGRRTRPSFRQKITLKSYEGTFEGTKVPSYELSLDGPITPEAKFIEIPLQHSVSTFLVLELTLQSVHLRP